MWRVKEFLHETLREFDILSEAPPFKYQFNFKEKLYFAKLDKNCIILIFVFHSNQSGKKIILIFQVCKNPYANHPEKVIFILANRSFYSKL